MTISDLPSPPCLLLWFWIVWALLFCSKTLIKACCLLGLSNPSSVRRRRSHIAFFAMKVNAIYSASVDDKVIMACFFKYQLIDPPLSMKIKLQVDFQSFLFPAQSESKYPSTSSLFWLPKVIPHFLDPLRYYRTIFAALVCWWPRFFANRAAIEVANVMSGLVSTIENMIEPVIPWYFSFLAVVAWPSVRGYGSADSFISVIAGWALSK